MAAPRLGDTLNLGTPGRIRLEPGETVLGSGKGAGGAVRWVLTDHGGHVTARIGVGAEWFGSREDEAGPWTADRDRTAAANEGRAALRAEADTIDARLNEIAAAAAYAAAAQGKTPAELAAERAALDARLAEIHSYDRRVTAATQWHKFGVDYHGTGVAPPEEDQWLTGYCEPGEFDRIKTRRNELRGLPEPPDDDPGWPRPAEPGEQDRLTARFGELDNTDTTELYAAGYTARLDLASLDQLRTGPAPAIARARAYGAELVTYYAERDRLEAAVNGVLGTDVPLTDAEAAQLDADRAALDAHKASPEPAAPPDLVDGIFGQGVIRGAWGDLHWRVEFDETANLDLGVVPHGQTEYTDLSDLSDHELAARLSLGLDLCGYNDADEVAKLWKQLDRISTAAHAAQAAHTGTTPAGGYRGTRRAGVALDDRWAAVVDAWADAIRTPFPDGGAVEEIDAWFLGFAGACRQIGEATQERAAELYGAVPLVGRLLDHLDQAGAAWAAIADAGDALHATWETEHAPDLHRQREPRPHESMLNVT